MTESHRERLLGTEAPDWFSLSAAARAGDDVRCFKRGHGRWTWRVQVGDRAVFVKVIRITGLADRLKQLVLGSPAEREWRRARDAERLCVPAVKPLAVGVQKGVVTQCVLITEELAGASDLSETWERCVASLDWGPRRSVVMDVIEPVALLFATAHHRGFIHRDAHPGNILLSSIEEGLLGAWFGDVHGARIALGRVSARRAARSLAHIDQHFQRRATRTERMRFLRSYVAGRRELAGATPTRVSQRALIDELETATRLHGERLAKQRDARMRRCGKYFSTFAVGDWRVTAVLRLARRHVFPEPDVADWTEDHWRRMLEPLLASFDTDGGGANSASRVSSEGRATGESVVLESAHPAGLIERLAWTLGSSRHRQAFERSHKLRHRDRWCPLVFAVAQHSSGGLIDRTVLVTPGAQNPSGEEQIPKGGAST